MALVSFMKRAPYLNGLLDVDDAAASYGQEVVESVLNG